MNQSLNQAAGSTLVQPEPMVTITRIENGFIVQKAFGGSARVFASDLDAVSKLVAGHFA